MNRGYLVVAQNTADVDYVLCARVLCKSLKRHMPAAHVSLLTDKQIQTPEFDKVILFPHGDQCQNHKWKLANDWQVYDASPYEHTIKLEADLFIPRSIEHWWDVLMPHDLVISQTIRNYTNAISDIKFYRQFVVENRLPDVYNAITYFRRSAHAQHFFQVVRDIFENWNRYTNVLKKFDQDQPTTDFVYAIAAHIVGVDSCTLPGFQDMSMIHMKQMINQSLTEYWPDQYVYEILPECLRINTIPQLYPFHYNVKSFAHELHTRI